MAYLSLRLKVLPLVCLSAMLATLVGCQKSPPTLSEDAGTTAGVQFPESNPPVLSKAVADRIKPGMSQDEVVGILLDAAKNSPTAKTSIENTVTLVKLNSVRLDLTVSEGKRKLVLAFRNAKLTEKKQEGLE